MPNSKLPLGIWHTKESWCAVKAYSVLIVDDDSKLQELLREYFQKENFEVYTASSGPDALREAAGRQPDIILLDLMLPGLDGYEVCRRLREKSAVPIIMLTARDGEADRLNGLDIGADDYVTKPFSNRELVARVRALLRRSYGSLSPAGASLLKVGGLTLDTAQHLVKLEGEIIELTPIEFSLLECFMKHPYQAFNRLQLMENSHGFAFDGYERTIDAHIRNLRRKIEPDPKSPRYILTIYGIGYKMGDGTHA